MGPPLPHRAGYTYNLSSEEPRMMPPCCHSQASAPESPGCWEHGCPKLFSPEWVGGMGEGRASGSKMVSTRCPEAEDLHASSFWAQISSNSLALRPQASSFPFLQFLLKDGHLPLAIGRTTRGNMMSHAKRHRPI